ncbi:type I restriction endonuclease, partial [Klebsiella pneumoniae]|nr:type I restriction endonuclease [Klebsiella pneumoniae]
MDKYVTEWEASDRYQSESELEHELIQDLRNQGYEFVPDLTSQSAMLANVRVQLQALNQVVFSEGEWRRFTEGYLDNPSDTLIDKTRKI